MLTKNQNGQSLIEFIVAVGIIIIIAGAGTNAVLGALGATRLSKEETQASAYAFEGIEAVKSIRNQNWDNLANGTYGLTTTVNNIWEFSGSSNLLDNKFTRELVITDEQIAGPPTIDTKKITSTVTWNYTPTRQNTVTFTTYLTDWQIARGSTATRGGNDFTTCDEYCVYLEYVSGVCRETFATCTTNDEIHAPGGDGYCTGGPSSNTCCCTP